LAPAPVIQTASFRDPATRGDDGSGNDAYDNFFFDMSIDTGQGKSGATALDFMGNNYCGLRNVTLKSSDPEHVGVVGRNMTGMPAGNRASSRNVVIDGFNYGIETGQQEYSTTFDGLSLSISTSPAYRTTTTSCPSRTHLDEHVPVIQNNSTTASLNGWYAPRGEADRRSPDVSAIQTVRRSTPGTWSPAGIDRPLEDPSGNPIVVPGVG